MNYKEIIQNVLVNGVNKQATRYAPDGSVIPVENGTIGTFCEIFRHDMAEGFPLTTLRKMPWKSIRVELEGFIKGITSKKWYKDRGCNFWNEWANPEAVAKALIGNTEALASVMAVPIGGSKSEANRLHKEVQAGVDDLGPIYGYQWRDFGSHYGEMPTYEVDQYDVEDYHKANGVACGTDQFKSIVDKLKTSPYDRRMVCSSWNPNQSHMMALPPCHWSWNVVVYGNKLNLIWHQRSCDLLLGVGSNIASYALLLMLLCEESGLQPGELVGTLADCHIYENHMDAARELVERSEGILPELSITRKEDGKFSIFDWEWSDAQLLGYNPQEKINVGAVTV